MNIYISDFDIVYGSDLTPDEPKIINVLQSVVFFRLHTPRKIVPVPGFGLFLIRSIILRIKKPLKNPNRGRIFSENILVNILENPYNRLG
jgi:hypothetical protein